MKWSWHWLHRRSRSSRVIAMLVRCLCVGALLMCTMAVPSFAQERGAIVFGDLGGASIGHADSEQGKAPIWGGGAGVFLSPRTLVEVDVQHGRVDHVFGRQHHEFNETTITGSLLFRAPVRGRMHLLAGGGLAAQRAQAQFEVPPLPRINRVEWLRLTHGRVGARWDLSNRVVLRTDAVLWIGGGLDWVLGGRVGLGYRF